MGPLSDGPLNGIESVVFSHSTSLLCRVHHEISSSSCMGARSQSFWITHGNTMKDQRQQQKRHSCAVLQQGRGRAEVELPRLVCSIAGGRASSLYGYWSGGWRFASSPVPGFEEHLADPHWRPARREGATIAVSPHLGDDPKTGLVLKQKIEKETHQK